MRTATSARRARPTRQAGPGETRAAILQYLRDIGEPVGVARICAVFGLNHTGVRRHLANLRDAGLINQSAAEPVGPGRPILQYQAIPEPRSTTDSTSKHPWAAPHQGLIRMLLDMVTSGEDARSVGWRAGEALAAEVITAADSTPPPSSASGAPIPVTATVHALYEAARRMGFDPQVQPGSGVDDEIVLHRCPFADGATLAPQVVCDLHLGMAQGVASAMGSRAQVSFTYTNPRTAGCRLAITPRTSQGSARGTPR